MGIQHRKYTQQRSVPVLMAALASVLLLSGNAWAATFTTFNGGQPAESDWRAAAGATKLEDFEAFAVGTQVPDLPALGIRFETLDGGGFPQIYNHFEPNSPYGTQHLGNFPNGINATNRFDDIVLTVLDDAMITALGFWNGDGQADTLVATAFDADMNELGSVGAFKGTFAGFVSHTAIAMVVFDGDTGDGWNHLDGLQTNSVKKMNGIAEPSTLAIFGFGLLICLVSRKPKGAMQRKGVDT